MVDRASGDHREDLITVAPGVGDALEHQHAATLGAGVAVGVLRERLDPAVGRQHAADLVESDGDQRGDQRVDTTDDRNVGFACAQRLHALVRCDQRARAGGVDGDRWAAEVVEVGHPVGDDRTGGAGDRVRVGDRRIGHRQEAVVVGGTADEDADALTAQRRRGDARVLQRLPRQLQRQPLLRVDVVGLHLRQREELGVKTLDVLQISAPCTGLRDPLGDPRLVEEFLPATLGQVGDRVAALQQRLPRLLGGVHVAGEPGGQADDRDVPGSRVVAVPIFLAVVGHVDFWLALDDDRGQRLDGRMTERDGGRQRHTGEILDVAGHRDCVT